jgi:pyrimidine operon attenuation protein/uracil phosphoribosyltransferase
MHQIIDTETAARGIRRMAGQIVERAGGAGSLALVGIRRGGVPLAAKLAAHIDELEHVKVPLGSVDISLYRDDASTALPKPVIGRSDIAFDVSGRHIVIVDDVLYTGRTVRAALDALLDYGRPCKIELAVLVDRGGRELPIQPNFFVKVVEVPVADRVDVICDEQGFSAVVFPAEGGT